jgi:hypothetical protein
LFAGSLFGFNLITTINELLGGSMKKAFLTVLLYILLLVTLNIFTGCSDHQNKDLFSTVDSNIDIQKEIVQSSTADILTYNNNIKHFFSFVDKDVLSINKSSDEIDQSNNQFNLIIDKQKDYLNLSSLNSDRQIKLIAKRGESSTSNFHLVGNGEIWIDGKQIVSIDEKFGNKYLEAILSFPTLGNNNYIKFIFNHNNKIINSNSEFEISIYANFSTVSKSFKGKLKSLNTVELNEFIKDVKTIFPSYLFDKMDNSFLAVCAQLNNKWLKWENEVEFSHGFIVTSQKGKFLMKQEPCYGNDDAWASTVCGIVAGLFNPFAGIAYAVIDTYIATNSEPC